MPCGSLLWRIAHSSTACWRYTFVCLWVGYLLLQYSVVSSKHPSPFVLLADDDLSVQVGGHYANQL